MNSNRESEGRKEMRKREWGERKKRIKKLFTWWIVTVYICMVTVHLQDHCVYLDIFTKTDVWVFGLKCAKLNTFYILENYPRAGVVALRLV